MKTVIGLALAAVVTFTTSAGAAGPDFAALGFQAYEPPKPAPAFALPDLDGKTTRLEDFRGKVLLLFYWATW
jgi:cytochrome oxidase Cu insertion factor (SCO1/SenC/PrrC family)